MIKFKNYIKINEKENEYKKLDDNENLNKQIFKKDESIFGK